MCPSWSDNNKGIGWKFKSRCKQWSEIRIGKSRNTTLAWRKIIHIMQKDHTPSNCNCVLQFFSGFLDCFKLEFYRLQQAEKSSSNQKEFNFIKLENVKSHVQTDRRVVRYASRVVEYHKKYFQLFFYLMRRLQDI